jgi:hypothetical protein
METKEKDLKKYTSIKGWGIDADAKNDPTYPMKHRTNEEHKGYTWDRPTLQKQHEEVLHSNERPNVSAVFGTTLPPKGLSGWIRRMAFRYSENQYRHWLPLILADRVNVIEGIVDDILHGHLPNYYEEKGLGVLWKHKKKTFMQRVAVRVGMMAAATFYLFRKNTLVAKKG